MFKSAKAFYAILGKWMWAVLVNVVFALIGVYQTVKTSFALEWVIAVVIALIVFMAACLVAFHKQRVLTDEAVDELNRASSSAKEAELRVVKAEAIAGSMTQMSIASSVAVTDKIRALQLEGKGLLEEIRHLPGKSAQTKLSFEDSYRDWKNRAVFQLSESQWGDAAVRFRNTIPAEPNRAPRGPDREQEDTKALVAQIEILTDLLRLPE